MRNTTACLLFSTAMAMCGCTDPIHEIDQSVDCNDVCNRYRSCYDQSYDVDSCRHRCESFVAGCSHGPTRTSTTTTEVSERPTSGGQTVTTTTETVQVAEDGTQSTDTTGTTHTVTPPS